MKKTKSTIYFNMSKIQIDIFYGLKWLTIDVFVEILWKLSSQNDYLFHRKLHMVFCRPMRNQYAINNFAR